MTSRLVLLLCLYTQDASKIQREFCLEFKSSSEEKNLTIHRLSFSMRYLWVEIESTKVPEEPNSCIYTIVPVRTLDCSFSCATNYLSNTGSAYLVISIQTISFKNFSSK